MTAPPRVFAVPPGRDLGRDFAAGFRARFAGAPPETIWRTTIWVNTARAREVIEHALADAALGPLPRLAMIPDLADPVPPPGPPGTWAPPAIAPAIAPVRRQLRLTRLVERFLAARRGAGEAVAPVSAAPDLAAELALLMDQMHDAGLGAEALEAAVGAADLTAAAAAHWQQMRAFLDLVLRAWPEIRAEAEGGALDPRDRQRRAVDALIARWAAAPPTDPVIAVATTGSVASTADLLAAIARLPDGAVVLPGLDPATPDTLWDAVAEDHPLGPFRGTLDRLGLRPSGIAPWTPAEAPPRAALLAQALRPAPVTDHWHREAEPLRQGLASAAEGLSLIEAETPRHEADAIAVALREALDVPGRTAALVTADAALARRVAAALGRFAIVPDDTIGQPLALSAPGRLLGLSLDLAATPGDAVALAAVLQHPLVTLGRDRAAHLAHARAFDRRVLRGGTGFADLPDWPEPRAGDPAPDPDAAPWRAALAAAIAPLAGALAARQPLGALLAAHAETLARLCARPDAPPSVWENEAGALLRARLAALVRDASAHGDGPVESYPALLTSLLAGAQVRPKPRRPHPRIAIIGTREARFLDADLVVVAGLNEGGWPAHVDPGPWLGRPMRAAIGLPLPERSVGLAAHDFLMAASRPEVVLSRARKVDGAETVASRWLIRLETLVNGVGGSDIWDAVKKRGDRLGEFAARHAAPTAPVPRAARPAPRPPVAARPRSLPATGVETLIRDAYAVYARHVLRLRALDPLGRTPDARDRGTVIHRVLERFVDTMPDWPGPDAARAHFDAVADAVLAAEVPWPDLRRTWRARLARATPWFLATEEARRADARPLARERRGAMTLTLPGGPFELRATADRIDIRRDGTAAVYDYKTGKPPSDKEIGSFNHQLHIAAAILAAGGYPGIDPVETSLAAYVGMTGGSTGGEVRAVEDIAAALPGHMARLAGLLSAFDNPEMPYLSLGRMQRARDDGEYDHLARRAEWEDGA